ncbi:interferon-induced protein 44-like [Ruditapes philippinarum]|uniref:interferon-induced protein 44-like n=1 Tax=Ruditapes philippinarum TaxID=129788 RepID=UPI00295B2115|nr:interferon-induced protein 44-like [Ruditapes philippinarum]
MGSGDSKPLKPEIPEPSRPSQRETSDTVTPEPSRTYQLQTSDIGHLLTKPEKEKLLTDKPWRQPSKFNFEHEQKIIEHIRKIQPEGKPNLLISGPVGAGKSAFISALISIGEGTKNSRAQSGSSATSFTVKYIGYSQKTLIKHFILRDMMGIEPNDGAGFHVEDFIYLVKGHIKNKYTFNPASPITPSDSNFRATPEPMDVIHCVIFVISAVDVYNDIPEMYIRKIGQLQDNLRMERIPRILVLTKIDQLCKKVQEDINNIFRSIKVQKVVKTASEVFHIDQASIHPVVNYEDTGTLTPEQNIPLLLALEQSMVYADGRVQQSKDDEEIR